MSSRDRSRRHRCAWPRAAEVRNPPQPPYAEELRDRLVEAIAGEVGFGGGDRTMYAYDASVYRQVPVGGGDAQGRRRRRGRA
ncbi:hypothetical protein ABZ860_22855 [Microbispora sp. NPDC046973]|uniref:hypothetical protein n=1 Tax=Microbispora sp. NPDC046973 TaxID=3155022 RepID=UPI0033F29DF9